MKFAKLTPPHPTPSAKGATICATKSVVGSWGVTMPNVKPDGPTLPRKRMLVTTSVYLLACFPLVGAAATKARISALRVPRGVRYCIFWQGKCRFGNLMAW